METPPQQAARPLDPRFRPTIPARSCAASSAKALSTAAPSRCRTLSQTIAECERRDRAEEGLGPASRSRRCADRQWRPSHPAEASVWGAQLDGLRGGPLDKLGAGSRILGVDGHVNEDEIARLASFGGTYADPDGGTETGLNAAQITDLHERQSQARRQSVALVLPDADEVRMAGPARRSWARVQGDDRYLSVAEVRTLFNERQTPDTDQPRLSPSRSRRPRLLASCRRARRRAARHWHRGAGASPINSSRCCPTSSASSCRRPCRSSSNPEAAYWLEQNWSLEDRHWFHHASQGTATFPVPYSWFMALEQPRLHLLRQARHAA